MQGGELMERDNKVLERENQKELKDRSGERERNRQP